MDGGGFRLFSTVVIQLPSSCEKRHEKYFLNGNVKRSAVTHQLVLVTRPDKQGIKKEKNKLNTIRLFHSVCGAQVAETGSTSLLYIGRHSFSSRQRHHRGANPMVMKEVVDYFLFCCFPRQFFFGKVSLYM